MDQRQRLLGEKLVEAGIITPAQLQVALKEQVQSELLKRPARLGDVVVSLGFMRRDQLEDAMQGATKTDTPARTGDIDQLLEFLKSLDQDPE